MINDVLSEALEEIDRYLGWEIGPYLEAEVRARIVALRDQMDALRLELDPPLDDPQSQELRSRGTATKSSAAHRRTRIQQPQSTRWGQHTTSAQHDARRIRGAKGSCNAVLYCGQAGVYAHLHL